MIKYKWYTVALLICVCVLVNPARSYPNTVHISTFSYVPPDSNETISADTTLGTEDTAGGYFNDAYPIQKDYYAKEIRKHNFDQQRWLKLKKGIDYNEADNGKPNMTKRRIKPPPVSFNLSSNIAQIILIGSVIIIIVFVMYRLVGTAFFRSSRKVKASSFFTLDNEKENLDGDDLEDGLLQALKNKDYRLILRIHYLLVIKHLWKRKYITWKIDKTNYDYLNEMFGKPHFDTFKELTRLFEYLWYGDQEITEQHASTFLPKFKILLEQLRTEENK